MNRQEIRLGKIIKTIANKPGITLQRLLLELSEQGMVVSERTLAKDILVLKTGFRLLSDRERLREGYVLQDMCTLAGEELELVIDAMHVFGNRLNDPEAIKMLERLRGLVENSEHYRELQVERSARTIRAENIYRKKSSVENLEKILLKAIRSRMPVLMTYHTPRLGHPEKSQSYPLFMVFHERGWYCIVRQIQEKTYFPRRLDRIKECRILDKHPLNDTHQEDKKEAQFLLSCGWGMTFPRNMQELKEADRTGEIVVRFDSSVAPYMLEAADRHPRGKLSASKDGSGQAEFRIRLANPAEFQFWVRSFGAKAWFVAPQSLVDREKAELRRMAQRYGL